MPGFTRRQDGAYAEARKQTQVLSYWGETLVELSGIEPLTSSLRTTRSPN
jgi:hypothetical protein